MKAAKYRTMAPDEVIRDGDEYSDPDGKWYKSRCVGMTVATARLPFDRTEYRRVVEAKPRTAGKGLK